MDFLAQFAPCAAIVVVCVLLGMALKWKFDGDERKIAAIPWLLALVGGALGIVARVVMPEYGSVDYLTALAIGIVSGLGAGGAYQVVHQQEKLKANSVRDKNYF